MSKTETFPVQQWGNSLAVRIPAAPVKQDEARRFKFRYLCPDCGGPLSSSKGYEKIAGRCPAWRTL